MSPTLDRLVDWLAPRRMRYRRVPRTGLRLSAVGFGTCQLRRVPEQQALDTLKRGFELGVNVVHTAPDYEGADDLVAQAVAESGRDVVTLTQGYGDPDHFRWLFGEACRKQRRRRLEMFGIACIDDREYVGENVWGPGGQVELLREWRREGRIGGTFCTTHGTPEYIARLVDSGAFDAIMLASNPLGFHLLSFQPYGWREREDLPRNLSEVFPRAARRGVALFVMKPLAGGLLCPGQAFPERGDLGPSRRPSAGDVLRSILARPEVTCVFPGTASVAEAEENARAGHAAPTDGRGVSESATALRATLCSRCGACETTCSQELPVSWLFRDAYVNAFPSETFETLGGLRYFNLHPRATATCSSCPDVTCSCPAGIPIPESLEKAHGLMTRLRADGLLPPTPDEFERQAPAGSFGAKLLNAELPPRATRRARARARLWLHNASEGLWPGDPYRGAAGRLAVRIVDADGDCLGQAPLRHDVHPGTRTHVVVDFETPGRPGDHNCRSQLVHVQDGSHGASELRRWTMTVS